jgi:hypothetical protein
VKADLRSSCFIRMISVLLDMRSIADAVGPGMRRADRDGRALFWIRAMAKVQPTSKVQLTRRSLDNGNIPT